MQFGGVKSGILQLPPLSQVHHAPSSESSSIVSAVSVAPTGYVLVGVDAARRVNVTHDVRTCGFS